MLYLIFTFRPSRGCSLLFAVSPRVNSPRVPPPRKGGTRGKSTIDGLRGDAIFQDGIGGFNGIVDDDPSLVCGLRRVSAGCRKSDEMRFRPNNPSA